MDVHLSDHVAKPCLPEALARAVLLGGPWRVRPCVQLVALLVGRRRLLRYRAYHACPYAELDPPAPRLRRAPDYRGRPREVVGVAGQHDPAETGRAIEDLRCPRCRTDYSPTFAMDGGRALPAMRGARSRARPPLLLIGGLVDDALRRTLSRGPSELLDALDVWPATLAAGEWKKATFQSSVGR